MLAKNCDRYFHLCPLQSTHADGCGGGTSTDKSGMEPQRMLIFLCMFISAALLSAISARMEAAAAAVRRKSTYPPEEHSGFLPPFPDPFPRTITTTVMEKG